MKEHDGTKLFTMSNWYYFGFFHSKVKRLFMLILALIVMSSLVFYVVPFKYAIGVYALCLAYLLVYILVRKGASGK